MKRLALRGDDMGSCTEANAAIIEAVEAGFLKNISVMACGPAFDEGAVLLRTLQRRLGDRLNVGLHVTLNAEWATEKWGPILPIERVPSLVEEGGLFTPFPKDLRDRAASPDEMTAEAEAQLRRLRDAGLQVDYVDEHMHIGEVAGLRDRLVHLAAREGLFVLEGRTTRLPPAVRFASEVCYLGEVVASPLERLLADWDARLATAPTGDYLLVTHPGQDEGIMRRFHIAGAPDDGAVARERDTERQALCDPQLAEMFAAYGATCVTLREIVG